MLGYSPQGGSSVLQNMELVLVMELVYKTFVVYVGMYVRMLKLGAGNKYTNFTKGTDKKCYVRKHGRHIVSHP